MGHAVLKKRPWKKHVFDGIPVRSLAQQSQAVPVVAGPAAIDDLRSSSRQRIILKLNDGSRRQLRDAEPALARVSQARLAGDAANANKIAALVVQILLAPRPDCTVASCIGDRLTITGHYEIAIRI